MLRLFGKSRYTQPEVIEQSQAVTSTTGSTPPSSTAEVTLYFRDRQRPDVDQDDWEQEAVPLDRVPGTEKSLDELRQYANLGGLKKLICTGQFHVIQSMLRFSLITTAMLEPPGEEISILNLLLTHSYSALVNTLLDQQLVTPLQLNDKNGWTNNAVCVLIRNGEWKLLRRLMAEKLIPVAAFFKSGVDLRVRSSANHSLGVMAEIENKENQAHCEAVNQYVYESIGAAITQQDYYTADQWLLWFGQRKPLANLAQIIDFQIQAQASFAEKIRKAWFYPACAVNHPDKSVRQANVEFKKNLIFKVVRNAAQLAVDPDQLTAMHQCLDEATTRFYAKNLVDNDEKGFNQLRHIIMDEIARRKPIIKQQQTDSHQTLRM